LIGGNTASSLMLRNYGEATERRYAGREQEYANR
jgi:hypothetical protein